ncbi:deuterosome assembly protein 1 [Spea bombifrons]|uniref:deuterosome assembly protein 1 n=1 Tax=Spea bombifrons TaxID=233779 RepID=UPI002349CA59|nr:deuterosome assembly protein 1 [Spea bombifrons]
MQIETEMTQQLPGLQCCLPIRDMSCENELEDLMKQIDIMVNSKKVEWERQVTSLEQRLEARTEELAEARHALDQKTCELGILYTRLEQADRAHCEKVENYERQLQALKHQLCKLKKNYEKLSFYNLKNPRDKNVEPPPEDNTSQCEIRWLTQTLEEFKVRSKEWEKQRLMYQNHLKSLSEQRKSLTEKCELFQKQTQSYKEQLSNRTQLQGDPITNTQTEIRRLRCRLDASQETVRSDGIIIENLKSTVKEITLSRNSLKDENQRLLQELKKCQKHRQRMEMELSEAKIELQARDDLLRAVELDQRQIQKRAASPKQYEDRLENELSVEEASCQKTYKNEEEMKRYRLRRATQDQIENDPQKDEAENNDLERLRADVADLTAKLNQKDITIATVTEKLSRLEQELELGELDVGQQALKLAKEQQGSADHYNSKAWPESERFPNYHIKHNGKEQQLPVKMKAASELEMKALTASNAHRDRSFMEKNNSNNRKQSADIMHNGQSLQDEWEIDPSDSDWDSTAPSLERVHDNFQNGCLQNGDLHEDMDFPDFSYLFIYDQQKGQTVSSSTGTSFISAAEKFLDEENRRAEDFEKILNSHIEEMRRYSENTLAKYTILNQNRHI